MEVIESSNIFLVVKIGFPSYLREYPLREPSLWAVTTNGTLSYELSALIMDPVEMVLRHCPVVMFQNLSALSLEPVVQ
jgi:hypothetical protein